MKDGEIEVYYKGPLDKGIDQSIESCLEKLGYKMWASGYNLDEGVRVLNFDKDEN